MFSFGETVLVVVFFNYQRWCMGLVSFDYMAWCTWHSITHSSSDSSRYSSPCIIANVFSLRVRSMAYCTFRQFSDLPNGAARFRKSRPLKPRWFRYVGVPREWMFDHGKFIYSIYHHLSMGDLEVAPLVETSIWAVPPVPRFFSQGNGGSLLWQVEGRQQAGCCWLLDGDWPWGFSKWFCGLRNSVTDVEMVGFSTSMWVYRRVSTKYSMELDRIALFSIFKH